MLRLDSTDTDPDRFACTAGDQRALRMSCDRFELLRSEATRAAVLDALSLPLAPDLGGRTEPCPAAQWS